METNPLSDFPSYEAYEMEQQLRKRRLGGPADKVHEHYWAKRTSPLQQPNCDPFLVPEYNEKAAKRQSQFPSSQSYSTSYNTHQMNQQLQPTAQYEDQQSMMQKLAMMRPPAPTPPVSQPEFAQPPSMFGYSSFTAVKKEPVIDIETMNLLEGEDEMENATDASSNQHKPQIPAAQQAPVEPARLPPLTLQEKEKPQEEKPASGFESSQSMNLLDAAMEHIDNDWTSMQAQPEQKTFFRLEPTTPSMNGLQQPYYRTEPSQTAPRVPQSPVAHRKYAQLQSAQFHPASESSSTMAPVDDIYSRYDAARNGFPRTEAQNAEEDPMADAPLPPEDNYNEHQQQQYYDQGYHYGGYQNQHQGYQDPYQAPDSPKLGKVAKNEPMHANATEVSDQEIFARAASHVQLTGKKSIEILVAEVQRRAGAPERLDWKQLFRLTRSSGKTSAAFQRLLLKHGIEFEEEARRGPPATTIEMLMEADAAFLAKDFTKIVSAELPKQTLAAIAVADNQMLQEISDKKLRHVFLPAIQALLSITKTHLFRAGREPGSLKIDQHPLTLAVNDFSLQTHGFGPAAVVAVLEQLLIAVREIPAAAYYLEEAFAPVQKNGQPVVPSKKASENAVIDPAILDKQADDEYELEMRVLPRIGYGIDPEVITCGEMRRRVLGPEKMNPSTLISFLRRTKTKDTLPKMRDDFAKFGLHLDLKSKRAMNTSGWMSLTEREAMAMARETGGFLLPLPPSAEMRQWVQANGQAAELLRLIARSITNAMLRVGVTPPERKVDTMTDLRILRFAMISHHFGHTFFAYVMQWLEGVLA